MLDGFGHQGGVFGVNAGPMGIALQSLKLIMQAFQIGLQSSLLLQGFLPRLGRQDLDALGQQKGGFSLHLSTMLEFVNMFNALGQGLTQTCQRFSRQRGTGFGSVALPRHGICHFELMGLQ